MAKKYFELDFDPFGPNLGPKNIFGGFFHYQMLDIVASYHHMQFQGKRIQTQENSKKLHFGPDLGLLGPNSGRQFSFFKNLGL